MTTLVRDAVSAALDGKWEEAVRLNEQILSQLPTDIDALNRLAHAMHELGSIEAARKMYRKVLRIDKYNPIAERALKRLEQGSVVPFTKSGVNPGLFIEEPGVTKIVKLLRPGSPSLLYKMSVGTPVKLALRQRSLVVTTQDGDYLGILPDELSRQLQPRLKSGNLYEAFINCVQIRDVTIFIRETRRIGRYRYQPTFLLLNDQEDRRDNSLESTTARSDWSDEMGDQPNNSLELDDFT